MKLFIQMKFINNLDKLNFSKYWKFFYNLNFPKYNHI